MHAATSLRHWLHQMHDGSLNMLHQTAHLLHERDFWYFLAIIAAITALFSLLLLLGSDTAVEYQVYPYPVP